MLNQVKSEINNHDINSDLNLNNEINKKELLKILNLEKTVNQFNESQSNLFFLKFQLKIS